MPEKMNFNDYYKSRCRELQREPVDDVPWFSEEKPYPKTTFSNVLSDGTCTAILDHFSRELMLTYQEKGSEAQTVVAIPAPNYCDGIAELGGSKEDCHESAISPALVEAASRNPFGLLASYAQFCRGALARQVGRFQDPRAEDFTVRQFSWNRVRFDPKKDEDYKFELKYESLANQFYCHGKIDVDRNILMVTVGELILDPTKSPEAPDAVRRIQTADKPFFDSEDLCRVTNQLIGPEKFQWPCVEVDWEVRQSHDLNTKIGGAFWGTVKGFGIGVGFYVLRNFPIIRPLYAGLARSSGLLFVPYLAVRAWGYVADKTLAPENPLRDDEAKIIVGVASAAWLLLKKRTMPAVVRGPLWGVAALSVFNLGSEWLFTEYERDVHRRVTDRVYEQDKVSYRWEGGTDFLIVPYAVRVLRRMTRAVATDWMEAAVSNTSDILGSWSGPEIKAQVLREDRQTSKEHLASMREAALGLFVFGNVESLRVLEKGPHFDRGIEVLFQNDAAAKAEFWRQVALLRFQEKAKALVKIHQPLNDWARDVFTVDGRLREGQAGLLYGKLF